MVCETRCPSRVFLIIFSPLPDDRGSDKDDENERGALFRLKISQYFWECGIVGLNHVTLSVLMSKAAQNTSFLLPYLS